MDLFTKDNKIVKVMGNREYGQPNEGSLCVKGRFGMDFVSASRPSEKATDPLQEK